MAASATKVSWIAKQWKRGWEKIPVIMVCHCVSAPAFFLILLPNVFFPGSAFANLSIKPKGTQKYRSEYTVMRPDDPRVAKINKESPLDTPGIFG